MSYDVAAIRAQFPALAEGAAHFDGPGGTQTPEPVARAVAAALTAAVANRGTVTAAERRAESIVAGAREALADLLGADPRGIVFGRSATELTFHLSRTLAAGWGPGDEVVVSRLDHDCNVRPWMYAAEQAGASVTFVDFDPKTGELTPEHLSAVLSERTVLVAITAASNLIGTRPDLPALAGLAHDVGAQLYVDGVHETAHVLPDLQASGADFWVCSPYKFLGPHCGVLAARPETLEPLQPAKLLPSTDEVPERFELGTLPYELMAGATAAVDFLADLVPQQTGTRRERLVTSYAALEEHEERLLSRLEASLRQLPDIRIYSNAARRTPTLLFTVDGVDNHVVRQHLADLGVNAPASHFYAWEASHHLGLGAGGGVRVGLAPYTDDSDIDRLLVGLRTLPRGGAAAQGRGREPRPEP